MLFTVKTSVRTRYVQKTRTARRSSGDALDFKRSIQTCADPDAADDDARVKEEGSPPPLWTTPPN
jgi:hypothetical protein